MIRPLLLLAAFLLAFSPAARSAEWRGNYFPNVVLTDQDGKKHRFYDDLLRDKIVTINFMFTTCKDICPLDTANLLRVQELLGDRVGKDFFMYSISIDPENDSPEALKRYMETYGVKPGWKFLTGRKEDVDLLISKLAMRVSTPGKPQDHDTSIRLGNERLGQWIKRSVFDDPKVLANLMTDTLTNFDVSLAKTHKAYGEAKEIKLNSRGEYLFRTRCQACHTIGGGDRLGPDLANVVTSRPREWLRRWLKEPDKMLEEGDPVATALKAQFRNLPMPNFSFGDKEVDSLIEYMSAMDEKRAQDEAAKEGAAKQLHH
jgi:protein SCO1/2